MSYTLLKNAHTIASMSDEIGEINNAHILIKDNIIEQIGTNIQLPQDQTIDEIDVSNCLVTPGFVNTHHHLFQTFQRNVPYVQDVKLFDWLVGLYQIWKGLTPQDVYVSAQVGISELILSGCTTIADHYYVFPQGQPGEMLDETIRAASGLGARFHPTRGSMSRGTSQGGLPPDEVVQKEEVILRDSERVIDTYHDPNRYSMCRIGLAPCSPFSVTDGAMREAAQLARSKTKVRLHTHLAETKDEDDYCLETLGMRPLDYMEKVEWIGDDVWFAHGIHFNDKELHRLAHTCTGVAHCPASNLRLGSGICQVPKMLELGVPVGLGVDGSASNDSSNILREAQLAMLVHRVGTDVAAMPARKALHVATKGGAQVLGRDDIGQLAPNFAADIAVWDLQHIGFAGAMHDPIAALLFCTGMMWAKEVFINGKHVVKAGHLETIDINSLRETANKQAALMLDKAKTSTGIDYRKLRNNT